MNLGDKRKGHLKGHLNGRVNSRPTYGLPAKIWWVSVYLSTSLIDTLRAQLAGRAALLSAGHVQWVEDRCLDSRGVARRRRGRLDLRLCDLRDHEDGRPGLAAECSCAPNWSLPLSSGVM